MGSLTIQSLDDTITQRLTVRAAENGRSIEEEICEILRQTLAEAQPKLDLGAAIRARVATVGGFELDLPPREPMREPPTFD